MVLAGNELMQRLVEYISIGPQFVFYNARGPPLTMTLFHTLLMYVHCYLAYTFNVRQVSTCYDVQILPCVVK